jgi:hypothetical protein
MLRYLGRQVMRPVSPEYPRAIVFTDIIPPSLQNAEVIGYFITEVAPVFRGGFSEEKQDGVGKLLLRWIEAVVGDVSVHDGPEALDGVQAA